jgi:hypothetical protein
MDADSLIRPRGRPIGSTAQTIAKDRPEGPLPSRIVTFDELKLQYDIPYCRGHMIRLVRDGKFPCPIKLGPARIGWLRCDVEAYLRAAAVPDYAPAPDKRWQAPVEADAAE